MQHVQKHDADFEIKANAYGELKQIREHLDNLEDASPETKSKLQALLSSVKDGSLGAIKLAEDIKDGSEAVAWVAEKATIVAPIVAGLMGA